MNAEEVNSRNLTGDMVKNNDRVQDREMGKVRRDMLWERQFQLAIDPETAKGSEANGHHQTAWSVRCAEIIAP
jgi:thiamine biosynthesis protein ThiC